MEVIEKYQKGERDFRRANLYGANLYGANLYGANLERANLYGANLYGANLYGANLYGANLYGANLYGANLERANLKWAEYSVQAVLRANWGDLSEALCLELMRHDAENHPDGLAAISAWATGNSGCPFSRFQAAFYFAPCKEIWKPGTPTLRGWTLLEALAAEKGIILAKEENDGTETDL
jgi:hypothetical protein